MKCRPTSRPTATKTVNVTYGELSVVLFGALFGLVEVVVVCLAVYGLVPPLAASLPHDRHGIFLPGEAAEP